MSGLDPKSCLLLTCLTAWPLYQAQAEPPARDRSWSVCARAAQGCDFSGATALQAAVDRAADGDRILLRAGIHRPRGTRDVAFGDLVIRGAVVIEGKQLSIAGEEGTVLEGSADEPASALVLHDGQLQLSRLTIRNFHHADAEDDIYDGHGVFVIDGQAGIEQVAINGLPKMALSIRGDSRVDSSQLSVKGGHIGVWIEENAVATLEATHFSDNDSAGVAAYQQAQVTIRNSVFENHADDAVYSAGEARIEVNDSILTGNSPYALRAEDSGHIAVDRSYLRHNARDFSASTGSASVSVGANMLDTDPRASTARLRDCPSCPELVTVPAGELYIGRSIEESGKEPDQVPRHRVRVERPFAIGVHEVTRGEFARFIEATGHQTTPACNALDGTDWVPDPDRDWRQPGYEQAPSHPVVCISWEDASAYLDWLTETTGQRYRLPSEAEWEYAARSGAPLDAPANRVTRSRGNYGTVECCGPLRAGADRWDYTAPAGSLDPNPFGLHDSQGNVWEWVADCYHGSYAGAPADGSARSERCSMPQWRVVRGGSWGDDDYYLSPAYRLRAPVDQSFFTLGFRVARDLDESSQ